MAFWEYIWKSCFFASYASGAIKGTRSIQTGKFLPVQFIKIHRLEALALCGSRCLHNPDPELGMD